MKKDNASKKPKNMSESPSFDSDGPWANAWCLQPYTFSINRNQGRMGPKKSAVSKMVSRRSLES